MNTFTPENTSINQDIICHCSGTTKQQIQAIIERRAGTYNLERISRITGACAGCGGCEPKVQALLEKLAES